MADIDQRRVVLYTSEDALSSELFSYIYAHVAARVSDLCVAAVRSKRQTIRRRLSRAARKARALGTRATIEILSSLPIRRVMLRRDVLEVAARIKALPRPVHHCDLRNVCWVASTNGPDAVQALQALRPAILVQAGAGILRPCVFRVPTLGTLNLHHGIAPLIRGMESIYWGIWERKPEWIGATVHLIDEGIDTGRPLAYFKVEPIGKGEGFASLFARATAGGAQELARAIERMLAGEADGIAPAQGPCHYRSSFSGWKMLLLAHRLRREMAS